MKKLLLCALMALTMLLESGCVSLSLTAVQPMEEAALPEPDASAIPRAPTGDTQAERVQRVTLYYISADQQQLSPLSRNIRLLDGESVAEKAVERLLDGAGAAGLSPVVSEGVRLISMEISGGIATVNLSVDALAMDDQAMCWMKAAMANTLTGLEGIEYVVVLIDGKEESGMTLPGGALSATSATLTALWAQQQADQERFLADPATAQIERTATLYFGAWLDNRLLPETRNLVLSSGNPAATLIEEMRMGPQNPDAHAVLPADAQLLAAPEIATLEDGRRVLMVSFARDLYDKLERDSLSRWQMFSALSFTLCRFLPQLDGITVGVGGEVVTSLEDGVRRALFEDGVISPDAFDDAVARMGVLYFANDQGTLTQVKRAMAPESALSPRALLEQLIAGPYVFDAGALPIVPEGVIQADLLGLRVEDQCALVNLSSNFYRLCQGLSAGEERNLVYAIVNTLCALDGVDRVRFYVGGEVVETLAQAVYLKAELLPNPGLTA